MRTPLASLAALGAASLAFSAVAPEPGLLFHLSGDHGTTADFSAADLPKPTYEAEITAIADGARGGALRCGDTQLLAYRAPGNLYAQRGTLSFFWRSRYPVGPTEFPIFRVGYADHSSWDMAWLRIDYNGHGFDAFVTDASLARTRVTTTLQPFPPPETWTHVAFSWDETRGVRFYINGRLAAHVEATARFDAALDQFGPHSRIIGPWQVQSDYNFVRGGDLDELRIYDRMLDDAAVAALAKPEISAARAPLAEVSPEAQLAAFRYRYGFGRPSLPPALPESAVVAIRKVEIHEAFDLKRWWWKANDGIRETTWPGVYNRSRLPGRNDYFQLPDWDCYVESGRAITFTLPDEPVNQIEISGAAWGTLAAENGAKLFERTRGAEHTAHRLATPLRGGKITFTNAEQEQPIGELGAYHVSAGREPAGTTKLAFELADTAPTDSEAAALAPLLAFINGRHPPAERTLLLARAAGTPRGAEARARAGEPAPRGTLPLAHIVVPCAWDQLAEGLDGIALDLPAQPAAPNVALAPLNVQVRDPLWPLRAMLDVTFTVRTGAAQTLWLDLRDRLLPAGRPLYLTIAGGNEILALAGAKLRLVFKPREAARPEHELDRFTQLRDSYAMLVEEHPMSPKLDLWNRFKGDLDDLLRANPAHELGLQYRAAAVPGSPRAPFTASAVPEGVPAWAYRQVELLGWVQRFVDFYIDQRQSDYGDLGGGISDDTDLTNTWPGVALMGIEPQKIKTSVRRLLEAAYQNGMFTRGLPTIQADELHSYEEGINCLAQNLILDFGNPRQLERAMETARSLEAITAINAAGHRHVRTAYYSGTKRALEDPWAWAKPYGHLVFQVPQLLVDFNGNPAAEKYLVELADGLLPHARGTRGRGGFPAIHFADDREADISRGTFPWHMFWAAWRFTGDERYLGPLLDGGNALLQQVNANTLDQLDRRKNATPPAAVSSGDGRRVNFRNNSGEHVAWQLDGNKARLERLYAAQTEACATLHYINTEGSLWIDRVAVPTAELQRARLGGVALLRNSLFPGHTVSWEFAAPATGRSVAVLIPNATPAGFKVIAFNLETTPVRATMTGWDVAPGKWEITQGIDSDDDDQADRDTATRTLAFERSRGVEITLPPRAATVLTLRLLEPGTPYRNRPDIGIAREDVNVGDGFVNVRVHSLGAARAAGMVAVLRNAAGTVLSQADIPPLEAPLDLQPHTVEVRLPVPAGTALTGASVELNPDARIEEITRLNNAVSL
jgi:hypothetical protein